MVFTSPNQLPLLLQKARFLILFEPLLAPKTDENAHLKSCIILNELKPIWLSRPSQLAPSFEGIHDLSTILIRENTKSRTALLTLAVIGIAIQGVHLTSMDSAVNVQ